MNFWDRVETVVQRVHEEPALSLESPERAFAAQIARGAWIQIGEELTSSERKEEVVGQGVAGPMLVVSQK